MRRLLWLSVLAIVLGSTLARGPCDGGSCYPDIGDLLVGREDRLSATSTCGQYGPENYCIVSHLKDQEKCFICDADDQQTNHNVANVITTFRERLGTWWQSENGLDKVSLRLDLETSFHFTHLIMTFKTFRPAAMIIERSNDYGKTWRVYRYFAYDCSEFYPGLPQFPPREIDEVICDSRYSLIEPSTEGEVIYKVLEPSLIPFDDPYSPRIQDLLTITNLRINFTHMHTLGDDLLDSRENIKEKYYYSLYELIVRGNCFCYGHADECRPIDPSLERPDLVRRDIYQVNGRCVCQHNTQGLNCNECLPNYQDQPWRPADRGQSNECKPCNCNAHTEECHFDAAVYAATGGVSGGVCDNCQHNTMGRNCELCKPFFYHHPDRDIRDRNVCEACDCEVAGSINEGICDAITNSQLGMIAGQCRCKQHVEGPRCDRCKPGYYNLQESDDYGCTPCDCDSLGTLDGTNQCDARTGQCICKRHTTGRRCDQCIAQTWGLSADSNGCRACDCDVGGSYDDNCNDVTGQCRCRPHIISRRCSEAEAGFFVPFLDHYAYEAEDAYGNENTFRYNQKYGPPMMWTGYGFKMVSGNGVIEFTVTGLPVSMDYDFVLRYVPYNEIRTEGIRVSIVRPNAGNIPSGSPCDNTKPGDDNWTVSLRGHPTSFENLGSHCLEKEYSYVVRFEFPDGMKELNVDSLILVANYSGISMFHGDIAGVRRSREFDELKCQDVAMNLPKQEQNVICAGLVFSMNAILHDGALACDCDPQGSISSICDKEGGQCKCKPNVMGRRCDKCVPGTFGLSADGCKPCDCNVDGARSSVQYCDTTTGQCTCKNGGLAGRQCDRCKVGFYQFPKCDACKCNGHTEYCDQETGMCVNCRDHTIGDHCEKCEDGYYGDPRLGSQDQCKPCMCPGGPDSSRQFAETCSETYNPLTRAKQVICDCMEGYSGESCNQCAPGHYGNPHEAGGFCTACQCNDNVDYSDPNACDAQTGECTACLHDTAGPHCEYCRDYFYGNAFRKDCRLCACDVSGTEPSQCSGGHCHCDMTTGQCPCLPNMTGRQCESCLPNHYRGDPGQGCFPCNCHSTNSLGATCDEYTGQCECRYGFGGPTCAFCADGYWGNPDVACYECNCDTVGSVTLQCDRTTGQCPCVDGVGGRYCDRCKRGYTGQIPDCEPCGECFDNWDEIISDLKERTERAIKRAESIEETGITGAYEDDFAEIERLLSDLEKKLNDLNVARQADDTTDMIDDVRDRLTEQEKRLDRLEEQMDKIRAEESTLNEWLDAKEVELGDLQEKLEGLKDQKKNISKASPAAAYKQVEDAAERSENAELAAKAATTEPGSLVQQSEEVRAEVEAALAEKLTEFDDKMTQVDSELDEKKDEVAKLSLADLNADVCGRSTEECDDTCGGALCDQGCGGLGCNGAVTNAMDAKDRAMKTKEILDQLSAETEELSNKIQATKENALEAKDAAEDAKMKTDEVEMKVKDRNSQIRDRISAIREFLASDRAKPEEIEKLAQEVLGLQIDASRDKFDALAKSIQDLVSRLPDVDIILESTQSDLDRANQLLENAKLAASKAAEVAGDTRAVKKALEEAKNASELAVTAKDLANINIDLAQEKINDIVNAVGVISNKTVGMQTRVEQLESVLQDVERRIGGNKLDAERAKTEAAEAKAIAEEARDALIQDQDVIERARNMLNEKKGKVERLNNLKTAAEELEKTLNGHLGVIDDLDSQFNDYERKLEKKNDQLGSMLDLVRRLYADIEAKEINIRLCP